MNSKGGPVGINTISVAVGEEAETLEEIYEPYLIQQGFLKRTSQGRVVTRIAYQHMGITPPKQTPDPRPETPDSDLLFQGQV